MNETYNDKVVRQFAIMTVVWGIVGMLVGVIIAAQLYWPALNFDIPWLTYGRLRPLHTNAVIFAFGGCALMGTSFYVVQRTCHVRLYGDKLAAFVFWGWQAVILGAVISLPLGFTQGKEYAELEWPIDILIAFVWIAYAVVFFGTMAVRRVKHIYVANWFYGAFIITIAVLHIFNNLAIPVSATKSYGIYSGVVDAMMEWWYGHNAVGFFLTAGILGDDVLLRAQTGAASHLFLPPVGRALLGVDLGLHVGGTAPPALHLAARLGAVHRHGVLDSAARALVGRHDQRHDDPVGRVAQIAYRSDLEVHDRVVVVLRHVDLRGTHDVDQDGERDVALHGLGHLRTCIPARSAGWP